MLNSLHAIPSNTLGVNNLMAIAVRGDIIATVKAKHDGEVLCVVKDAEGDVLAEAIAWPDGGISAMCRNFIHGCYTDDPVKLSRTNKVARFARRLHTTGRSRRALLALAVEATHL